MQWFWHLRWLSNTTILHTVYLDIFGMGLIFMDFLIPLNWLKIHVLQKMILLYFSIVASKIEK